MSCPAVLVTTDSCQTAIEVHSDPIPPIVVDLCQQGPPGPPGYVSFPFYLTDGTPAHIALVVESLPFYLADGTSAPIALVS